MDSEGGTMRKDTRGFSLIELLIVVAIILIIAAIAIPNLMRARMSANEASAVGSIRTINTSEVQYNSTYGIGFAAAGFHRRNGRQRQSDERHRAELLDVQWSAHRWAGCR